MPFIAALFLMISSSGCLWSNPPSDRAFEDRFRSREADFKRLVSMFKEDSKLGEVTPEGAYLPYPYGHDKPKAELPPERMSEYRRLIKSNSLIAIKRGLKSGIFLEAFESDLEKWKGYVYDESPPAPLLNSLDDSKELFQSPIQTGSMTKSGYKKIADNWYLYLDIFTG